MDMAIWSVSAAGSTKMGFRATVTRTDELGSQHWTAKGLSLAWVIEAAMANARAARKAGF